MLGSYKFALRCLFGEDLHATTSLCKRCSRYTTKCPVLRFLPVNRLYYQVKAFSSAVKQIEESLRKETSLFDLRQQLSDIKTGVEAAIFLAISYFRPDSPILLGFFDA